MATHAAILEPGKAGNDIKSNRGADGVKGDEKTRLLAELYSGPVTANVTAPSCKNPHSLAERRFFCYFDRASFRAARRRPRAGIRFTRLITGTRIAMETRIVPRDGVKKALAIES